MKAKCNVCKIKLSEICKYHCEDCKTDLCIKHRYKFEHNCNVNILEKNKEKLTRENPVIISDKFIKI